MRCEGGGRGRASRREHNDQATGTPTIEQTGPGERIGGFVAIAPGVFSPDQTQTLHIHSLGNSSNGHEVVGGPGSQKPNHACDGKGIDYIDVCLAG